jgi:hypothetical protein
VEASLDELLLVLDDKKVQADGIHHSCCAGSHTLRVQRCTSLPAEEFAPGGWHSNEFI